MRSRRAGIPVIGALPRNDKVALPERHLGVVQAGETEALDARLEKSPILSRRMSIATGSLHWPASSLSAAWGAKRSRFRRRAAASRSRATRRFCSSIPHLVQGWRAAGAEIVSFSPLADEPPPSDCDLCWLPGGYPELHAGRLAAAARFREGLRLFAETRPVHGECGGYMALGESLIDAAGAALSGWRACSGLRRASRNAA